MAATALDNLQTAYGNACARLAELDAEPIQDRVRMTYTVGQRTYGWNEYRAALVEEIKQYADLIKANLEAAQMIAGPFTVISPVAGC